MLILPRPRFVTAPLLSPAIALCGGIVVQHYAKLNSRSFAIVLPVAVAASIVCLLALKGGKLFASTLALLIAFFCTGMVLVRSTDLPPAANRISTMYDQGAIGPGDPVEIVGVVIGEPEPAPHSFYLTMRVERVAFKAIESDASGTVFLLVPTSTEKRKQEYDALALHHGTRLRVMTKLDREDDFRNPGVSQFTEYLERKGYDATGIIKSPLLVERMDDERVFVPLAWVYSWRARLQTEFQQRFSAETAGVLNAALLGNPHNISAGAAERFRAGGTFHILVISGLQIAFIAGVAILIVRRVTQKKLLQFLLAALFLWAYAIAVGAEASVTRAALMFTLAAFAPVVSRRANSLNTVAGAGLVLLVLNPLDLFNPSFQLTFLSVVAIVCVTLPLLQTMRRVGTWRPTMVTPYPPRCSAWLKTLSEALFWSEREWRAEMAASNIQYRLFRTPIAAKLERWRVQKILRYALSAIVISASVQIVLLPLMILYFHRVSIASLLLNIFVGVLMVVLALTALAAVLVSQVSTMLGGLLVLFAEKTNWLMTHAIDPLSVLGLGSIRLPHYSGLAAGVYAVYFILLAALVGSLSKWNPLRSHASTGVNRRTVKTAAIGLAIALLVVVVHPFSATPPDGRLRVEFLDVGQGDSALLTAPDGTTILIDGGGQPNLSWAKNDREDGEPAIERDTRSIGEQVVSQYLWSRGLDRVDYLIATHADADHIDGLNDIVRNFKVRGAIVARAPENDAEFAKFVQGLRHARVPLEIVGAGDVIRAGNVLIDVLWPRPIQTAGSPSRNNDSLVLRVRFGEKSFLFTADIEKEAEAALVKTGAGLKADVVKVPHHGSKTSSTEPFVATAQPTLAIISVGRHSIFGHPSPEVVERWRARGAQVMTTGEKGTISVVTDGVNLTVGTFVP
ncbi:MAG TPA: ComEC/Rec2 family competence protein [Pyrinomonadaceae bacterium]|nr:ComEC/Rec2 family competence protein [Pyrinomonadaceae bacterium]